MKPNDNACGKTRAEQPITPSGDLHRVEAIWRGIVEALNPYNPEEVDEDRPTEGRT